MPFRAASPLSDSSAQMSHLGASAKLLARPLDLPASVRMPGQVLDRDEMGYTLLLL